MAMERKAEMDEVLADDVVVDEVRFSALRAVFGGELLRRADDGQDAARRVWNGNIDRRPALIARCRGCRRCPAIAGVRRRAGPGGVGT